MEYVELEKITIAENRQRRDFDPAAITVLARSILNRGLLHPPTLRNDSDTLVAGERRLRAITELYSQGHRISCDGVDVPAGFVPVLRLRDLPALEVEEAELEENTIRLDLSWQERANAEARLHALREHQAEERGEKQTITATASEIKGAPAVGGEVTNLSDSILLNNFLDDPKVSGAKSRKEAMSIVKKRLADEFTAKLAENFNTAAIECPHRLVLGDSRRALQDIPDGLVDVILTDPPYGIDAHAMAPLSGSAAATEHEYIDDFETASSVWEAIFREGARICAPNAAIYMFCDFAMYWRLRTIADEAGWTPWDRPLIWHKPSGGMLGDVAHGPRRSYETIFFAYRGDKRTTGTFLDVIIQSGGDSSLHAANKPVDLYVNLLKRSTVPGMVVLDPCCGSGPIFPAANKLNLRAIGIEQNERHYAVAQSRLLEK